MRVCHLLTGIAIGVVAGVAVTKQFDKQGVSPERALKLVKDTLQDKLDIEGSWVQMHPEKLEKNELNFLVYRGGITANENDKVNHYEFSVDKRSGAIIELAKT